MKSNREKVKKEVLIVNFAIQNNNIKSFFKKKREIQKSKEQLMETYQTKLKSF